MQEASTLAYESDKELLKLSKSPPSLFKTYFKDPTLSDLTIKLNDRSVYVHRIVLCRGSEYFATLLTGRFSESDSKDVELHEDDPEATMALLRHLYGLPYTADLAEWHDDFSLLPHALVYVTAEKYQIKELQLESCAAMSDILCKSERDGSDGMRLLETSDLLEALRVIITGTPSSDISGRELMIFHCVSHMSRFVKNDKFMTMVAQIPELGAELLGRHYAYKDPDQDLLYEEAAGDDFCEDCQEMTELVCSCCGN